MTNHFADRLEKCHGELLAESDPFVVIVRGHLFCESSLATLLKNALPKPEELNIERLEYQAKVNWSSALDLFAGQNLKPGLLRLGALRNKYVHKLDYAATESDEDDLVNTLKSTLGPSASLYLDRRLPFPNGLRRCVMTLWIPLEILCAPQSERSSMIEASIQIGAKMLGRPIEQFRTELLARAEAYGQSGT